MTAKRHLGVSEFRVAVQYRIISVFGLIIFVDRAPISFFEWKQPVGIKGYIARKYNFTI